MAKVIHRGPAKPDDPIYSSGLIVGGERLPRSRHKTPKSSKAQNSRDDLELRRSAKQVEAKAIASIENPKN